MASAKNITFDSFDLQDSTYLTRDINHRNMAVKILNTKNSLRSGEREVLDTFYTEKIIEVSGWIISDSKANLRTAIDNLKKALRPQEKNLDIDYGDGTIRYKATCQNFEAPEEHYHINQIPFEITFSAEPWGKATTTETNSWTGITATTYTNSITITGSFCPAPTITITSNKKIDMSIKFENTTTSEWVETTSTQTFSTNSVLTINTDDQTFELDSTTKEFDGVFPSFDPGTNNFEVTISGSSPDLDIEISYYPRFL